MTNATYIIRLLVFRYNFSQETRALVVKCFDVSAALSGIIFAYNFYVYLVTGKQFRSDLHKLLCRCSTSSSAPAPAIALAHTHSAPAPAVIAPAAADNDDDDDDDDDDDVDDVSTRCGSAIPAVVLWVDVNVHWPMIV